jgi:hypothetical protein
MFEEMAFSFVDAAEAIEADFIDHALFNMLLDGGNFVSYEKALQAEVQVAHTECVLYFLSGGVVVVGCWAMVTTLFVVQSRSNLSLAGRTVGSTRRRLWTCPHPVGGPSGR